jgi:polar amino acid transport system permease protein
MRMDALYQHFFNLDAFWASRVMFADGALGTIKLGVVTLIAAPLFGALVFLVHTNPNVIMRRGVEWFIDIMRAFPLLVFLVLTYYLLLPLLNLRVDPFLAAAVAFSIKHGVYFAEIYRSAWLAVDRGQFLAAHSLGLRSWRTTQLVIIPQVALVILPPLVSQATLIMRDLPLAFVVGYFEILTGARAAQVFVRNSTPLVGAIVVYSVMLLILQWLIGMIEQYSKRRLEL